MYFKEFSDIIKKQSNYFSTTNLKESWVMTVLFTLASITTEVLKLVYPSTRIYFLFVGQYS